MQVAFAARGQTISVAFFPRLGIVTYGSEAAATKAPLTVVPADHKQRLLSFFQEHDPVKVEAVDRTLEMFKGNEREMWSLLREKYPSAFSAKMRSRKVLQFEFDEEVRHSLHTFSCLVNALVENESAYAYSCAQKNVR